jgi:hypothetical protein
VATAVSWFSAEAVELDETAGGAAAAVVTAARPVATSRAEAAMMVRVLFMG